VNEFETLQGLQARTHLIADLDDKDQQQQNVAAFTRLAAWELRDFGYGNLKKTSGAAIRGLSIDKLIHRDTGAVMDICTNSDTDNPGLSWNHVDDLSPSAVLRCAGSARRRSTAGAAATAATAHAADEHRS